jgi:hypothetical protein
MAEGQLMRPSDGTDLLSPEASASGIGRVSLLFSG